MGAHLSKAEPAINTLQVVQSRIQFPAGPTAAPARIMVTTDRPKNAARCTWPQHSIPLAISSKQSSAPRSLHYQEFAQGIYRSIYHPSRQGSGRHLSSKHCYFSGPMFLLGAGIYVLPPRRKTKHFLGKRNHNVTINIW